MSIQVAKSRVLSELLETAQGLQAAGLISKRRMAEFEVVVYEPMLTEDRFFNSEVVHDLPAFKARCDLIVANRRTADLADVDEKVYTRDLFGGDV